MEREKRKQWGQRPHPDPAQGKTLKKIYKHSIQTASDDEEEL